MSPLVMPHKSPEPREPLVVRILIACCGITAVAFAGALWAYAMFGAAA